MELRDKRITVVGLARSGVGAARLLSALGSRVTVTDRQQAAALGPVVASVPGNISLALGGHPEELFTHADLIVLSPGVPLGIAPLRAARNRGIPIIGELELACRIVSMFDEETAEGLRTPIVAVTGSNGKSTTTALVELMLRTGGVRTLLGGNIGNALTEELVRVADLPNLKWAASRPDWIVAEVSSFQLEAISEFRPAIAAVLNITPDHLDRYHSFEEYAGAKMRICENQTSGDWLVLNAGDPAVAARAGEIARRGSGPGIRFFSRAEKVEGVFEQDGTVFTTIGPEGSERLIRSGDIRIRGVHNLENAMAASAMALLAGCPVDAVRQALCEFGGLEHRLEFVKEIDGVRYINDSKGTNVGAVAKSLEGFSEPVILIAGGRDKAGDFSALRDLVARKVKGLVLIGEAAGTIRTSLADLTETKTARDLEEAVALARSMARSGDVVLLSPACASFDMFRDFEDRGRQFKGIVTALMGKACSR